MRSMRALIILAALTVLAVAAAFYTGKPSGAIPRSGELLLPDLLAEVNEASAIAALRKGERYTLERRDGRWVVRDKGGYPADQGKVRQLLLGLAQLRRIEPKTAKPERYVKLGLADPEKKDSEALRVTVTGKGGATLADLIVGKRRFGKGDPDLSEFFVRQPDDPQSWLVEGKLPSARDLGDWLDQQIAAIDHARIRAVRVTHPDGEVVEVRRGRDDPDYRLAAVPPDQEVDGDWKVNDIGRALEDLRLDDVLGADEAGFAKAEPWVTLELTTYDGLRVTMRTARDGKRTLARLEAAFDPALVEPAAEKAAAGAGESGGKANAQPGEAGAKPSAGSAEQAGQEAAGSGAPSGEEKTAKAGEDKGEKEAGEQPDHSPEAVRKEAAELNARWSGWVYVLPSYKADYLAKRRADLLKPREKKAAAEQGSAEAGG